MSARTLIEKLRGFKGQQIMTCEPEIRAIAEPLGYVINVMDPDYNVSPILADRKRLNVMTDRDSVITNFTTG